MAVKATLTMHEDTGKAATLAALGTLQAALQASVTQAQVLDLIEQALGGAEVEERVRAAVEAAVQALPPVAFKFGDNAPVKLQGRAHVKAARLAAYMARCTPVLVKGPAGSGKTTSVCEIARMAGYEVFLVTPSMTRYDVLGYQDANGHQVETQVTRFAQHEGDACLVLDEVDGWADGAQLAANTLLANLRVVLSKGEVDVTFDGKHRKMFVATANTWGLGANAQYVGRKPLDEAFRNRFVAKLDWPYDEEFERELALARLSEGATSEQRANAGRAVGVVQKARAYVDSKGIRLTISPRQTFEVVRGLEAGDSMGTLFREVVLGGATEEQMRDVAAHVGVTL
jgi:cobaltochelatase CobS